MHLPRKPLQLHQYYQCIVTNREVDLEGKKDLFSQSFLNALWTASTEFFYDCLFTDIIPSRFLAKSFQAKFASTDVVPFRFLILLAFVPFFSRKLKDKSYIIIISQSCLVLYCKCRLWAHRSKQDFISLKNLCSLQKYLCSEREIQISWHQQRVRVKEIYYYCQ